MNKSKPRAENVLGKKRNYFERSLENRFYYKTKAYIIRTT